MKALARPVVDGGPCAVVEKLERVKALRSGVDVANVPTGAAVLSRLRAAA